MSETSDLLLNTAERLFTEHCDKSVLTAADEGKWSAALWTAVEEAGLTAALVPEEAGGVGISIVEALTVLRPAARFSAPIPLAETMLASWLLAKAGLPLGDGPHSVAPVRRSDALTLKREGGGFRLTGSAGRVPWGRNATTCVVLAELDGKPHVVAVAPSTARITESSNVAHEPRDDLAFDTALSADAVAPAPAGIGLQQLRAFGAAMRANQIAGALAHVLEITVQYAQDRVQFGRPIGKFQAIQQNLAVLAGQAAAATAAADMAAEAVGKDLDLFVIGSAKARAGEAASIGSAIAHQVHGAIGFTHEHQLHYSTRRLWSWRDEFGNEAEWTLLVGRVAASAGADRLWATITAA